MCDFCEKFGHTWKQFRSGLNGNNGRNGYNNNGNSAANTYAGNNENDILNVEQSVTFYSLGIQSCDIANKNSTFSFVLNSSATDYLINDDKLFKLR